MLISHRKKFIYTKTKKTAGTSVECYFEKYCLPSGTWAFSHAREETVCEDGVIGFRGSQSGNKTWWNHMSAHDIRRLVGEPTWNDYFKFCVIRNPFEKMVSAFHFFERQRPSEVVSVQDRDYQKNVMIDQFRDWIKNQTTVTDRDTYMIDGEMAMDYVIRYEDLKNGIRLVCDRLELPFEPHDIPVLKAGVRDRSIPVRDYYDETCLHIVETLYRFEINCFGYDRP